MGDGDGDGDIMLCCVRWMMKDEDAGERKHGLQSREGCDGKARLVHSLSQLDATMLDSHCNFSSIHNDLTALYYTGDLTTETDRQKRPLWFHMFFYPISLLPTATVPPLIFTLCCMLYY